MLGVEFGWYKFKQRRNYEKIRLWSRSGQVLVRDINKAREIEVPKNLLTTDIMILLKMIQLRL